MILKEYKRQPARRRSKNLSAARLRKAGLGEPAKACLLNIRQAGRARKDRTKGVLLAQSIFEFLRCL